MSLADKAPVSKVRLDERKLTVDELVGMYLGRGGKINPWFTRCMKRADTETYKAVMKRITEEGLEIRHAREVRRVQEEKSIELNDDEWDRLAESCATGLLRHPERTLAQHANKIVQQWPGPRRKQLTAANIGPLLERLKQRQEKGEAAQQRIAQLEEQLRARPTREEVLDTLTDEEVLSYFRERVLEQLAPEELLGELSTEVILDFIPTPVLVSRALQRVLEGTGEQIAGLTRTMAGMQREIATQTETLEALYARVSGISNGNTQRPKSETPSGSLPRVVFTGLTKAQFDAIVYEFRGRIRAVYVERESNRVADILRSGCDIAVLFLKRTPPAVVSQAKKHATRVVQHLGGMTRLSQALEAALSGTTVAAR